MYHKNCELCKFQNSCKGECKYINPCKLYAIVNERGEDVATVKGVNVNARLPVRGTSGPASYDLSTAQSAIVLARGKCLVKTGLAMAISARCYGRIAPRSG